MQHSNQITVAGIGVWLEPERHTVCRDGLVDLASPHEPVAEICVSLGIVGLQSYGFLMAVDRLIGLFQLRQQDAQVKGDLGGVGFEPQGPP